MTDAERTARLRELNEAEEHARDTLRKLNYPSSPMDYLWWGATWFSSTRSAWRSAANRALEQIAEERAKLEDDELLEYYPTPEEGVKPLLVADGKPPNTRFALRVQNYTPNPLRAIHLKVMFQSLPTVDIAIPTLAGGTISEEFTLLSAARQSLDEASAVQWEAEIQNDLRELGAGRADSTRSRAIRFTYLDMRAVCHGAVILLSNPHGPSEEGDRLRITITYDGLRIDSGA